MCQDVTRIRQIVYDGENIIITYKSGSFHLFHERRSVYKSYKNKQIDLLFLDEQNAFYAKSIHTIHNLAYVYQTVNETLTVQFDSFTSRPKSIKFSPFNFMKFNLFLLQI